MSEPTETSAHTRRAVAGDRESLAWIVARFSPLLAAQAHYRLGKALREKVTPEEILQEAWAIALQRLSSITFEERVTPVVMKFLSTIVLHRVNHHLRVWVREATRSSPAGLSELAQEDRGVLTNAIRSETIGLVLEALEQLSELDRDVLVLRLIEQRSGEETATQLGLSTAAVYVRQHRAVAELRKRLPKSLFDELERESPE